MTFEITEHIDLADLQPYLDRNLLRLNREGRDFLKPPPDISGSDWADQYGMIPETDAEPGKWSTARVPHSRFILDAASDYRVRIISLMGSVQIGKTAMFLMILGRRIHLDPSGMLMAFPDDTAARDFSKDKFDPLVDSVPVLKKRVAALGGKKEEASIYKRKILGGFIRFGSALSKGLLRMRSIKVAGIDDVDAIEINAKEGDPIMRMMKRSTTFKDALLLFASSPTRVGSSRIKALFDLGNQVKFYVRCIQCDYEFYFDARKVTWKKDLDMFGKVAKHYPETAYYPCPNCEHPINERERIQMLNSLYPKPEDGHDLIEEHISIWLNEAMSTLSNMKSIAQSVITAGEDPEKLEALWNTVYGLPYEKIKGESLDPKILMDRMIAEDWTMDLVKMRVPNKTLFLTAAVDVQQGSKLRAARLEVSVMAWGLGFENWIIYRNEIPGNSSEQAVWDALDNFWKKRWFREDGLEIQIELKAIDTGYNSNAVYKYVRGRYREGFRAIKGKGGYGAELLAKKPVLVDRGRVALLIIGTNTAVDNILANFDIEAPGPGYTHFARSLCDSEYFDQLLNVTGIEKYTGLIQYTVYEKKDDKKPNEAHDLFVYNYAMAKLFMSTQNWKRLKEQEEKKLEALKEWQIENPNPEIEIHPPEVLQKNKTKKKKTNIKKSNYDVHNW